MTPEQLEALSLIELKAMVYDAGTTIENCQKDIQILSMFINKKSKQVTAPKEVTEPKKVAKIS